MSSKSLLVHRGTQQVNEVSSGSDHEYITVLTACSAAGDILLPFVLYKGKNLYQQWIMGGPVGTFYGVSESGWMDSINFLSWFHNQFMSAVHPLTESGPVVLILDGHYSHVSLELLSLLEITTFISCVYHPTLCAIFKCRFVCCFKKASA